MYGVLAILKGSYALYTLLEVVILFTIIFTDKFQLPIMQNQQEIDIYLYYLFVLYYGQG